MATCRWLGRAADIQQKSTITVANTWAAADTARVTIAGNNLTVVVDTNDTAVIAQEIAAAINATDLTTGLIGSEVRNVPGQTIPEFREVTAEASASTVLVYAKTFGKPFTMTVGETTAGTGTLAIATTIAATGKHFWDNINNWSTGSVPANGDDIVFDSSDVSVMYGLPQSALNPDSFRHYMSYTGRIGLPVINRDDPRYPYPEYRDRYVCFDDNAAAQYDAEFGIGDGNGSSLININFVAEVENVFVYATGTAQPSVSAYALNIKNPETNTAMDLRITSGSVALAPLYGDTCKLSSLTVGFENSQASDVSIYIGPGTGWESINGPAVIYGGTVVVYAATEVATVYGGTVWYEGVGSDSLTINSGTVYVNGDSVGMGNVTASNAAVIDLRRGTGGVTFTTLDLYKGATLLDPHKRGTYTAGVDLNQCKLSDVTLDVGPHRRLTLGTPA